MPRGLRSEFPIVFLLYAHSVLNCGSGSVVNKLTTVLIPVFTVGALGGVLYLCCLSVLLKVLSEEQFTGWGGGGLFHSRMVVGKK